MCHNKTSPEYNNLYTHMAVKHGDLSLAVTLPIHIKTTNREFHSRSPVPPTHRLMQDAFNAGHKGHISKSDKKLCWYYHKCRCSGVVKCIKLKEDEGKGWVCRVTAPGHNGHMHTYI
jgi:hypothetical protein